MTSLSIVVLRRERSDFFEDLVADRSKFFAQHLRLHRDNG